MRNKEQSGDGFGMLLCSCFKYFPLQLRGEGGERVVHAGDVTEQKRSCFGHQLIGTAFCNPELIVESYCKRFALY
jgi:hypothetical protein